MIPQSLFEERLSLSAESRDFNVFMDVSLFCSAYAELFLIIPEMTGHCLPVVRISSAPDARSGRESSGFSGGLKRDVVGNQIFIPYI